MDELVTKIRSKQPDSIVVDRAYPDNHSLFVNTVIDQIKMLRNHPSLYIWVGGNEFTPPADIDKKLKNEVFPKYDRIRYYLNESTSTDLAMNTLGGNGDGPYGIQNPLHFFTVTSFPFNPELGSVGVPNVETMRKIMVEKDLVLPGKRGEHPTWTCHKYIGYDNYIDQYGKAVGIDDFCKKAQLVNYEQYRALQEGFSAGMWTTCSGMLVWKNQNPWTALRGQFHDVFLEQNGGFYGYQHGAVPLHIQLNLNDSSVCVVNQTLFDQNFYWLSQPGKSYEKLNDLKQTSLQAEFKANTKGEKVAVISNPVSETAFFIRLKVVDEKSGELSLPVFLSDNYFTLMPGESREINVDLMQLPESEKTKSLNLEIEGWNI